MDFNLIPPWMRKRGCRGRMCSWLCMWERSESMSMCWRWLVCINWGWSEVDVVEENYNPLKIEARNLGVVRIAMQRSEYNWVSTTEGGTKRMWLRKIIISGKKQKPGLRLYFKRAGKRSMYWRCVGVHLKVRWSGCGEGNLESREKRKIRNHDCVCSLNGEKRSMCVLGVRRSALEGGVRYIWPCVLTRVDSISHIFHKPLL